VAYRFQDTSSDKVLSRASFITWLIIPQLLLTLLAFILVRVVLMSARYWPDEDAPIRKILPIMGNMVALPQVILTFALLQIFLYNAYQIELISIWVFALIIMIAGGIILGVVFFQAFHQSRRQRTDMPQE
jgi:amino acid transporter